MQFLKSYQCRTLQYSNTRTVVDCQEGPDHTRLHSPGFITIVIFSLFWDQRLSRLGVLNIFFGKGFGSLCLFTTFLNLCNM